MSVLLAKDCDLVAISKLLKRFSLKLIINSNEAELPGSFWGDNEAGLIQNNLHINPNTPIHSLLHEACHFICMDATRRKQLNTNAGGDYDEENAVCFLQIVLADHIAEMGRAQMLQDMDEWGYSFRLGSAKKWFELDAEDAKQWLIDHQLINNNNDCLFRLREY